MTETIDIGEAPSGSDLFPEDRLAATRALLEASALVSAVIERSAVRPAGLDAATADLLVRLSQAPRCGIRGVDIGAQCQMTATRVSRLLDRAEADGLVRRMPDPSDRRAQHIVLTEAGAAAAADLAPMLDGVLEDLVFAALSDDERLTLIHLLDKLRDRARAMLNDD